MAIAAASAAQSLLICIDGTHANPIYMSDKEYDSLFRGSHVRRIAETSRFGPDNTIYIRGPNGIGASCDMKFMAALEFIGRRAAGGAGGVALNFCGYSRGGAIALDLANAFAQPPDGLLAYLRKQMSYGHSTQVVDMFQRVRSALGSHARVETLAMFDAVDMASQIDGDPVEVGIGTVAHVVRSSGWASRKGWGNVGTMPAEGTRAGLPPFVIDGTHAALGGVPGTGDLPKPLVKAILALPPHKLDWQKAERIYDGTVPVSSRVAASVGSPGLFVHTQLKVLVDAGAHALLGERARLPGSAKAPSGVKARIRSALPRALTLRETMRSYLDDSGGMRGSSHLLLDMAFRVKGSATAGAFESLTIYFVDSAAAIKLINEYRARDAKASRLALREVRRALAEKFPATL